MPAMLACATPVPQLGADRTACEDEALLYWMRGCFHWPNSENVTPYHAEYKGTQRCFAERRAAWW